MIKNLLIIGLTFFKIFGFAQSFSATYGFPELTTTSGTQDPSNTPTVTGLQFGAFNAYGTTANPNASARFSFTGWPVGAANSDDNYGNYTANLSPNIYYEMKLSIVSGYTLHLNELNFDLRRSGTGIRTFCVRSSLDNYTNNLAASTGTNTNLEVIPNNIFFWKYDSLSTNSDQKGSKITFDANFSSLTGTVVLRFYAWNSESSGGSFSLDNVNFTGTMSHILSPSAISEKTNQIESIRMYPNPCSGGKLFVNVDKEILKTELFSLSGFENLLEIHQTESPQIDIDLSSFSSGVYFLRLHTKNGTYTQKLLLKN